MTCPKCGSELRTPVVTPVDDIINDLESLLALFRDYNASLNRNLKPVVPVECMQNVVREKLTRIGKLNEEL